MEPHLTQAGAANTGPLDAVLVQSKVLLPAFGALHLRNSNWGFPGDSVAKNPPENAGDAGDVGLIPEWGRSPGGGNDNPLQYSCLKNSMEKGDWRDIVHRVTKSGA